MKNLVLILCGGWLALAVPVAAPAQVITNQPQSVTVNNASTATFTVGASNALTYQWQFNGTNLDGATNSSLTLEGLMTNQEGSYTVIVGSLNAFATSSPPAILTIVPGTVVTFTFSGLLSNAPGSNVDVQLFDHDKPATVANFIHYIRSGGFSNVFFDRLVPGFVLQGGDYGANDRTNTKSPLTGWYIPSQVTDGTNQPTPPYPPQVDSEFNVGPLIHNRFGTVAMALAGTDQNSANSAFFLNLADNSGNLDAQDGGFTVFGRILDGTNVLQYFNTLGNGGGIDANAKIIFDNGKMTNSLSSLPVNYIGSSNGGNASLVFCDFTFQSTPPVDATPPTVAISAPAPGVVLSNGAVVAQGTAADNVAVAVVTGELIPQPAPDGTLPNGGVTITNFALGTTNWSLTFSNPNDSQNLVPPGLYNLSLQSQDGSGNLSVAAVQQLIFTAIVTNGNGGVIYSNGAFSNMDAVGYPFQTGSNYVVTAVPAAGQLFVDWTGLNYANFSNALSFLMFDGQQYTANFISNGIANGLAFTAPAPNAVISNAAVTISGTISNVPVPPATVSCQVYSTTTFLANSPAFSATNAANWSFTVSNLISDIYVVEATAVDAASNSTFISEEFTISLPVEILTQPQSLTINTASSAEFTVSATNAMSYQWQFDGTNVAGATASELALADVATNQAGSYTVVVSSSFNSVTSAPAVLTLTNGTLLQFVFYGLTNGNPSNVVNVQLFDHDKPATVQNFLHYVRSGAFSNMFFERCIPKFILQGGDYGASNRTDTNPPMYGWDIKNQYSLDTNQNPPFPPQVDSEFNIGPLVHNTFGTLAMALAQNQPDSATSGFFFNLTNNSATLDPQSFTVFGRIIDAAGSNTLNYFNVLSNKSGIVTNGRFFDGALQATNASITNLPVDYRGTNAPANTNLFFCDFLLPDGAPVDTNPPTVAITSPAANVLLTNGTPVVTGTASDDVSLAVIICKLIPQAAADGTYANGGAIITNDADGTTNWSLTFSNPNDAQGDVPPGSYILSVQAQDGAGNLSATVTQPLTITMIITNGSGTVTFSQGNFTNLNAIGYPFQVGSDYTVTAAPEANWLFDYWSANEFSFQSYTAEVSFPGQDGLLLTAHFINDSLSNALSFTFPASNAYITTNAFEFTGLIGPGAAPPVTVTCQLYSSSTFDSVGGPLLTSGTTSWSEPSTNLADGSYVVVATAVDQNGNSTLTSEDFTVSTASMLQLNVAGPGTVTGVTNGETIFVGNTFAATAVPNPGQLFYSWSDSQGVSINPMQTFTMTANMDLTAIFLTNNISNFIAFASPASNAILAPGLLYIAGTIANTTTNLVSITCQVFSSNTSYAVTAPLSTQGTTDWVVAVPGELPLGSYTVVATATDPTGDSTLISEDFSVSTNLPLELTIQGPGTVTGATNGELIPLGESFQVQATPYTNQFFYSWSSNGAMVSLQPDQTYVMSGNLSLTATFITNNNSNLIAFTSPKPNGAVGTNGFEITGLVSNAAATPVYITCQVFSQSTQLAVSQVLQTTGVSNWSLAASGLSVGDYILVATGGDAAGEGTLISEDFSVSNKADLQLEIDGGGTVTGVTNGQSLAIGTNFQATALPNAGQVFYQWNDGSQVYSNATQTFTMTGDLVLTATFVPDNAPRGISFTYPPSHGLLQTNTFRIKGRIAPAMKSAQITCQLFQTNGVGIGPPLTVSATNSWAIGVTNLPGGIYTVQALATNAAGLTALISEPFIVLAFSAVQGTYAGLFICTNVPVAPTNSGFMSFTVSASGVMSGKLLFPAYAPIPIYPTLIGNYGYTTGYTQFGIEKFHGESLFGNLYLDLSGENDYAAGTISTKSWSAQLFCYRAAAQLSTNTTPPPGKFVLSLQSTSQTNGPYTNGYAAFTLAKNGRLTIGGALPDNTTFADSARMSLDGVWPFYAVPSGVNNKGMLLGWEVFSNSGASTGQWDRSKAAKTGHYYTNGVGLLTNLTLAADATNFTKPVLGGVYAVVFQGGTLNPPVTNYLNVSAEGQFIVVGGPADKLKLALAASGVLTGSLDTNSDKTLRFQGAFLNPSQGGSGFIPEADGQTGSFSLTLVP